MPTGGLFRFLSPPGVPASELAGVLVSPEVAGAPGGEVREALEGYVRDAADAVSANGSARVTFGPVPQGRMWLVQRYVVAVENNPGSVCSVYVGQPSTLNLEDGTAQGDLDVGTGDPPLIVPGGEVLTFEWLGAGSGNRCIAKVQYVVARLEG